MLGPRVAHHSRTQRVLHRHARCEEVVSLLWQLAVVQHSLHAVHGALSCLHIQRHKTLVSAVGQHVLRHVHNTNRRTVKLRTIHMRCVVIRME